MLWPVRSSSCACSSIALQVLQVTLDEQQAAARRSVIAVAHQPAAKRHLERRIDADDLREQEIEGREEFTRWF